MIRFCRSRLCHLWSGISAPSRNEKTHHRNDNPINVLMFSTVRPVSATPVHISRLHEATVPTPSLPARNPAIPLHPESAVKFHCIHCGDTRVSVSAASTTDLSRGRAAGPLCWSPLPIPRLSAPVAAVNARAPSNKTDGKC